MDFYEVVGQVLELLQCQRCVSYRALKLQFHLDDDYLEGLRDELIYVHPVVDDDGRGLIWTGESGTQPEPGSTVVWLTTLFSPLLCGKLFNP